MGIRRIFSKGPTVVKFHFTNSETTKEHFYTKKLIVTYEISKFSEALASRAPSSDAHVANATNL